jgi:hypothetical protein
MSAWSAANVYHYRLVSRKLYAHSSMNFRSKKLFEKLNTQNNDFGLKLYAGRSAKSTSENQNIIHFQTLICSSPFLCIRQRGK